MHHHLGFNDVASPRPGKPPKPDSGNRSRRLPGRAAPDCNRYGFRKRPFRNAAASSPHTRSAGANRRQGWWLKPDQVSHFHSESRRRISEIRREIRVFKGFGSVVVDLDRPSSKSRSASGSINGLWHCAAGSAIGTNEIGVVTLNASQGKSGWVRTHSSSVVSVPSVAERCGRCDWKCMESPLLRIWRSPPTSSNMQPSST